MRKFRFYLAGLVPGLLIVFFILNAKGAKCTGYLPDSRVRAEVLTKNFIYGANVKEELLKNNMDEKFLRDSAFAKGTINFDKSHPRQNPCPDYVLEYPEKNPRCEISFVKCQNEVTFTSFKMLKK